MSTRKKQRETQKMRLEGTSMILHILVHPLANQSFIKGKLADGSYKVDIAAPPEDGKANAELIRLLAKELGIPKTNIEILSGTLGRRKVVRARK